MSQIQILVVEDGVEAINLHARQAVWIDDT